MTVSPMSVTGQMTTARFCDCEGIFRYLLHLQALMAHPSQDIVFCRTGRGLQERIDKKELGLKCNVHHWGGAWEIEELFNRLS